MTYCSALTVFCTRPECKSDITPLLLKSRHGLPGALRTKPLAKSTRCLLVSLSLEICPVAWRVLSLSLLTLFPGPTAPSPSTLRHYFVALATLPCNFFGGVWLPLADCEPSENRGGCVSATSLASRSVPLVCSVI